MKLFLSIVVLGIYSLSFWILKLIYLGAFDITSPTHVADVNTFTDMRYSSYAIILMICMVNVSIDYKNESIKEKKLIKFVSGLAIGLSTSDVLDRFCFDITTFQTND